MNKRIAGVNLKIKRMEGGSKTLKFTLYNSTDNITGMVLNNPLNFLMTGTKVNIKMGLSRSTVNTLP